MAERTDETRLQSRQILYLTAQRETRLHSAQYSQRSILSLQNILINATCFAFHLSHSYSASVKLSCVL